MMIIDLDTERRKRQRMPMRKKLNQLDVSGSATSFFPRKIDDVEAPIKNAVEAAARRCSLNGRSCRAVILYSVNPVESFELRLSFDDDRIPTVFSPKISLEKSRLVSKSSLAANSILMRLPFGRLIFNWVLLSVNPFWRAERAAAAFAIKEILRKKIEGRGATLCQWRIEGPGRISLAGGRGAESSTAECQER